MGPLDNTTESDTCDAPACQSNQQGTPRRTVLRTVSLAAFTGGIGSVTATTTTDTFQFVTQPQALPLTNGQHATIRFYVPTVVDGRAPAMNITTRNSTTEFWTIRPLGPAWPHPDSYNDPNNPPSWVTSNFDEPNPDEYLYVSTIAGVSVSASYGSDATTIFERVSLESRGSRWTVATGISQEGTYPEFSPGSYGTRIVLRIDPSAEENLPYAGWFALDLDLPNDSPFREIVTDRPGWHSADDFRTTTESYGIEPSYEHMPTGTVAGLDGFGTILSDPMGGPAALTPVAPDSSDAPAPHLLPLQATYRQTQTDALQDEIFHGVYPMYAFDSNNWYSRGDFGDAWGEDFTEMGEARFINGLEFIYGELPDGRPLAVSGTVFTVAPS